MQPNYNIGIYGISGSGKSTLIKTLCAQTSKLQYFEGSKIIESILNDDISNFKLLDDNEKYKIREEVINTIQRKSNIDKYSIIDGHYCFLKKDDDFEIAITKADLEFYTHIFYMDIQDEIIKEQQLSDKSKKRDFSIEQINKWKEFEKLQLEKICKKNNISFHTLASHSLYDNINYVLERINKENFSMDLKKYVNDRASNKYILLDADNTIINFDTGKDYMYKTLNIDIKDVKACFEKEGYCFSSFFELSKLHSNIESSSFVNAMKSIALEIKIEDDFLNLIKLNHQKYNICIVTAGFTILWQEVLKKYNLETIKVFSGNNLNIDSYIIDNNLKGFIASYLQEKNKYVVSFGDSLLDKDMLINSNKGYFVIRNKIRDDAISKLCEHNHIKYLSIHSLKTNNLIETNFNQIHEELN